VVVPVPHRQESVVFRAVVGQPAAVRRQLEEL
jgi:hypothetical protein